MAARNGETEILFTIPFEGFAYAGSPHQRGAASRDSV